MNISFIFIIVVLMLHGNEAVTIKTLHSQCLCDISDQCDTNCCCDHTCSSNARQTWSKYDNCYNPGLPIPVCAQYQTQLYNPTDLYHGLNLIYTIVKRLFCISKINFADQANTVVSKTTDSQLQLSSTIKNQIHPSISNLALLPDFPRLPMKDGVGRCSFQPIRDMNTVAGQRCRIYVNSNTGYSSSLLYLPTFLTNNPLINSNQLKVYTMESYSSPTQTSVFANTISSICGSTSTQCQVIKHIQFFFIKTSSGVTLDYTSSYIVLGTTIINGPTFVSITYSYQFKSSASVFPFTSTLGYTIGSYLNFLQSDTTTPSTYYKMINPVNLDFMATNGECINSSLTSQKADQSNLVRFQLGVNTVLSCLGTKSQFVMNLMRALKYVGLYGSSSNILNDYVEIDYTDNALITNDARLIFYYHAIGTETNPQYKIVSSVIQAANDNNDNIQTLFIEYMQLQSSIQLNVPNPPTINAYLPDDFLYPFYVAA